MFPAFTTFAMPLASIAVSLEMDVPFDVTTEALLEYHSVSRRFDVKGEVAGIMVVDDFAHHPTEIIATLEGVRSGFDRRIVAVFQPHLFSRTRDFHEEFGRAFMNSDVLIVTDIYPARETPVEGVTGKLVADAAVAAGHRNVRYIENKDDISGALLDMAREKDIVITFGAGDIHRTGVEFLSRLEGKYGEGNF